MENTSHPGTESSQAWSVRMVDSVMKRAVPYRWHYEYGLVHKAVEQVWLKTGEARYFDYIWNDLNPLITPAGVILTYQVGEYNLDQIYAGRLLFLLYRTTGEERFKKALDLPRSQLRSQPRTRAGGFWHKQIYPYQMWLDGVYMAGPFYAEYGRAFDEPAAFDDVVHEIVVMEQHARDPRTGLLYHAWDESKQMPWADPQTGCSPHFWGRALGWYAMAIVEILEILPAGHPGRALVLEILQRLAVAVLKVQDPASGLWYQVLDQGGREANYLEASGSGMFVYSLAKAARLGYLPLEMRAAARRGYQGMLEHFVRVGADGLVNLEKVCGAAGLGGVPYRDGSYEYYTHEKIITNDYKGVGPFILASVELEEH